MCLNHYLTIFEINYIINIISKFRKGIINYLEIELEIINLKHNYLKICVQNYLYYRKWHNLQIRTQIRQAQMMGMS